MDEQMSIDPKGEIKSLINKKVDAFNAITELIDDSIDADSVNIKIQIHKESILVIDDGTGYTDEAWKNIDKMKKPKKRNSNALGCFNMGKYVALCSLVKDNGGSIETYTLQKDKNQIKYHKFGYDLVGDDINLESTKEPPDNYEEYFCRTLLFQDIDELSRKDLKKILSEKSGTITVIRSKRMINYGLYSNDILMQKIDITYYHYLRNNSIHYYHYHNEEKKYKTVTGFDRLHLKDCTSKDVKDYTFKLLLKNEEYYIDFNNTLLDVPKQNGNRVRLNQMNQFNYIVPNYRKIADINIRICKVNEIIHEQDYTYLEFLRASEGKTGRVVPYIAGLSLIRNSLREMSNPNKVVSFGEDINTVHLKTLRGFINYTVCENLSQKEVIQLNNFFGVTSEKDVVGKLDDKLTKLVKCLVYEDCKLFSKKKNQKDEEKKNQKDEEKKSKKGEIKIVKGDCKPSKKVSPTQKQRGGSCVAGYLYLYTLEDSLDWKNEEKTIYKFGKHGGRDSLKNYLKTHQNRHPTKLIKLCATWHIKSGVDNKETEILSYFQDEEYQYNAVGTSTSEFVQSESLEELVEFIEDHLPVGSKIDYDFN
jgi:hypothetical protein